MPDREADLGRGGRERVGLVDIRPIPGDEMERTHRGKADTEHEEPAVDEHTAPSVSGPHQERRKCSCAVDAARDLPSVVVRERVLADVTRRVEVGRERVPLIARVGHGLVRFVHATIMDAIGALPPSGAELLGARAEGFGQHPNLGNGRHEVGIACPPRERVEMEVAGNARTRGPPDIGADIHSVGPIGA